MSNHAYMLVRSGPQGLASFMRKLLTRYGGNYNRQHGRHGHLFQNRYKSIIAEEEELVLSFAEIERLLSVSTSVNTKIFDRKASKS
jgi:hypothetical protein